MEQVIFGGQGFGGPLDSAVTRHNSLQDGSSWFVAASEFRRYQVISTDGVIKNLRFRLSAAPGAGKKYTFTLMLNGNPTALTFDIADAATSGSNMVDEVAVTGGDTVDLQCVPDNTPTSVTAAWSSVFESDNPNESLIMGNPGGTLHRTATEYGQAMTSATELGVIENDRRQVIPTSGKITNLYVWLDVDPGTAPDAYRFTVRLNGATVAQSPIVTITANDKTGSDLVHELAVVAGDYITLMVEPVNTPSAWPYSAWGMTFVADEDGESIVIGGSYQGLDRWNSPRFGYISHVEGSGWDANENRRYMLGQVCTLKKLNVLITAPPGVGNQWDFTLRIEGADSNVTLDIVDPNTTGDSGALEDTVALSEYVVLRTDPTDIPDAADAYWGFVCYIEPPVPSGSEDLLGKFDVGQDSAELLGEAEIQQSGSAELLGKFEAQATAELFGKAVIRHSDTAELLGELDVGQGSAELLGKFEAQTTAELLGKAEVQQSGSAEILGKFEAQATAELLGRFEAQATAELLGKAEVQQSGSTELLSNAVIRHVGAPVELLGRAIIRNVGSAELLGKAVIRHSVTVDLYAFFESQASVNLSAKFQVTHSENLFSKLWIRHPSRLWTNRRYINGVVELDETELDDALLEYVIEGVMNDIRSQLISEAMLVYDSWTDITKTPKLIRRATTYGTVANLYSRDINDPNRRIVLGLRPMRIRAAEIRSAQERAMDYWESRMEKMMSLYLTSGGRRLIIVDTEDEEAVFSIEDIPFYSEDPFKIKVR